MYERGSIVAEFHNNTLEGIRTCHPKICHFGIRIILRWRGNSTQIALTSLKPVLLPHSQLVINAIFDLFLQRWHCVHATLVLRMYLKPRIFSLWNSSHRGVAWSPLGSARSFNKDDLVSRSNMDKYRTDWSDPARLEFFCAFSCTWTLYHNWPSSKTLQSKLALPNP